MANPIGTRSVTQIPRTFPFQSYFDSLLLERAILAQPQGAAIIPATKAHSQTPGVGVTLHPSSESPVAIRFRGGDTDSSEIILTPGQTVIVGNFTSFDWGLPFGWLGGGTVLLYVMHRPDAMIAFPGGPAAPIPFHRARLIIGARTAPNLPMSFPWPSATSGTGPTPQSGSPIVNVTPTATLFRLRSSIIAPTTLSAIWWATDVFDVDATGGGIVEATEIDLSFPAVTVGSFPIAWLQPDLARIGGDVAYLQITDPTAALTGAYVDMIRYGTIG